MTRVRQLVLRDGVEPKLLGISYELSAVEIHDQPDMSAGPGIHCRQPSPILSEQVTNPSPQFFDAKDCPSTRSEFGQRPHITPIRAYGSRPPLFCIFPGPPGSSEFADLLPEDQPLYDFYFTKLDGASNFPVVEDLAQSFLKEIRNIQPHGPYQLCGYSKAGLVAYEIASLLLAADEEVSFLALFETWHPGFEQHLTRIEYLQFRLLYLADRFAKYGRDLSRGKFAASASVAWKAVSRRFKLFGWRMTKRLFGTKIRSIPPAMQQAESIVVLKSFVPKPLPKRFMLIRTDDPFERRLSDATLGWRICATKGVDVRFVYGDQDHGTMMNMPHVRFVIEAIAPHLAGGARTT